MSLRFPLYAKILLWFFLNLLLLTALFYVFVAGQLRLGFESLLTGRAGDHVQAVTDLIVTELRETPRGQWGEVLARFGQAYHVRFLLARGDAALAAGAAETLPTEVRMRVGQARPPGEGRPADGGDDSARPRRPDLESKSAPPGTTPPPYPKFMVRAGEPPRYWIGVRVPPGERGLGVPGSLTLLIVSDTLSAGGLLVDVTPWLAMAAGAVMLSALLWLPLVRGVPRSVGQMTRATEQIAEGRFDTRVGARRRDELGRLGHAVNRMAARLEGYVTGQRRFLGDIAHELCAPIARLQLALGILEQRADEKQMTSVADVRDEVQQMSTLVNELLTFSKASLGGSAVKLQSVDVRASIEEVVAREAADEARVKVVAAAGLRVRADAKLLKRALANLLRNSLRYAGHAGPITIAAARDDGRISLRVTDSGPGVPEEALARLFDPFYRVDASRSRDTGGAGLGLAIVKTCVEACGGTASARNRQPSGLEVELTLDAAKAAE